MTGQHDRGRPSHALIRLALALVVGSMPACGTDDGAHETDAGNDAGPTDGTETQMDSEPEPESETGTDTGTDGGANGELDAFIEAKMEEGHLPGLAACVTKNGGIPWCNGYGFANIGKQRPASEDTPFLIASAAKTVTATALLQVWERGAFAMDDDVNDALDFTVANPSFPNAPITYHQLFTHTSSIDDNWDIMEEHFYFYEEDPQISLADACAGYLVPSGAYYAPSNYHAHAPGAAANYSNLAVALLGHTLEANVDEEFAAYSDTNIFAPLGMENTSWRLAGLDVQALAMPYYWTGSRYRAEGHFTVADYPDGGLMASARDMARFVVAWSLGGSIDAQRILEEATVKDALTEQRPVVAPGQGLIWNLFERDGQAWAGHEGGEAGVATTLSFRIDDGLGVVLLINADWPRPETPVYDIERRLIEHAESL